jgi:hypothetical protein
MSARHRFCAVRNVGFGPITVRVARTSADFAAACHLVHVAYSRAGLESSDSPELRITDHQLLDSTDVFVARQHGEVIATLSLVADSTYGLPMESMYRRDIADLRRTGTELAEVGCLADRPGLNPRLAMEAFFALTRFMAQRARWRAIDTLVAAVHPRHARFYTRMLGFKPIGSQTTCPYAAGHPAIAVKLRFVDMLGTEIYDHYFAEPIPDFRLGASMVSVSRRLVLRRELFGLPQHQAVSGVHDIPIVSIAQDQLDEWTVASRRHASRHLNGTETLNPGTSLIP